MNWLYPTTLARLTLENADPAWFWLTLAIGSVLLLLGVYRGIYQRSGKRLTWSLAAVRIAAVLALIVALVKPAWTTTAELTSKPRLAIIVDDSQSMTLPHRARREEIWSPRFEKARVLLRDSELGRQLSRRFDVSYYNLAGKQIELADLQNGPNVEQTDLVRALRSVAARLRGQQAAGIVLISDGCDTTGRSSLLGLEQLPAHVYGVGYRQGAQETGESFDLAITAVEAPGRTMVHNAVPVKLLIRKDGGPALSVPVRVERAGAVLYTQRLDLPAGSLQTQATITYTPAEPGDFVLAANIPQQDNERSAGNNKQLFKLRVDAEPMRVIYVEGVLRPEYSFLRDRLAQDPDIDLITFVREANPEQTSLRNVLTASELFKPDRLQKVNVVVLGDFEASLLDDQAYKSLRQWLDDGGGLMVLGGYQNLGEQGFWRTPLGPTLPVEQATGGERQVDSPFGFRLSAEGALHPAMFLSGDTVRDAATWETLPRLLGVAAVGPARPGATVLARHPSASSSDGQGYVVLATQSFGKGVTALMTADSTWRWSRLPRMAGGPDTLYVRFWAQMVRYLAHRDVQNQQTALTVSTDAAAYQRGERVSVSVTRNAAAVIPGEQAGEADLQIAAITPDQRTVQLAATRSVADLNLWTASFFPDRGGRFEINARLVAISSSGQRDLANQSTEFLVQGSDLELADPSTNPTALVQIANATGGVYADIDDAGSLDALLQSLPAQPQVTYQTQTARFWNSPLLFLSFLALVSGEWIVRRRNQLV